MSIMAAPGRGCPLGNIVPPRAAVVDQTLGGGIVFAAFSPFGLSDAPLDPEYGG
jgi:hypothetical protein